MNLKDFIEREKSDLVKNFSDVSETRYVFSSLIRMHKYTLESVKEEFISDREVENLHSGFVKSFIEGWNSRNREICQSIDSQIANIEK